MQNLKLYIEPERFGELIELAPGYTLMQETLWQEIKEKARANGNSDLENSMMTHTNPYQLQDLFRESDLLIVP